MNKEKRGKLLPKYAVIPLLCVVILNQVVYNGAMIITKNWPHYNLEIALDRKIPFVPWTIVIYFGCYFFGIVNYILAGRQKKSLVYRFCYAEMFAKLICFAFYLLLPTTNIRPEITGNGIWEQMVVWLYQIDMPSNLFPSIHCLVSWFCFIGVRGRNDISKWYQCFSFLMAVAVFVSTLTTKQHVLVDVIGGVGIAEFCYWVSGRRNIGEKTDIYSEKN